MRTVFAVALLLLAVFYTAMAFADFNFLSPRGRIAPGFFPQIIGTLLVFFTLSTAIIEFRRRQTDPGILPDWGVTLSVNALVGVFIVASYFLGALPGMIIFMLLTLSILNRGKHVVNLMVGIALPVLMFVSFRFWLNAAMPPGMIGLPY